MAKLTEKEREGFEKILWADLSAINSKFMNQLKDFWNIARQEVLGKKGWDKLIQEKKLLEKKKQETIDRLHEIEEIFDDESLKPEQIVELGGKPDEYGKYRGATFYGIPVESQFDYEIVEYIRQHINIEIPSKIIRDICQASIRELTMAGTFEEAREAYLKFYSLDFRKFGVDIPPRLDEIKKDTKLIITAQKSISGSLNGKKQINNLITDGNLR